MELSDPKIVDYLMLASAALLIVCLLFVSYATWMSIRGDETGDVIAFCTALCFGLGINCLFLAAALDVNTKMWWALSLVMFISFLLLMWIARPRSWYLEQHRQ